MTSTLTPPAPAEYHHIPAITTNVILATECSGGKLTIIEEELSVGTASPELACNCEDKVIYIAEGRFVITVNAIDYHVVKGNSVFVPQGVKHITANAGTSTGKLLITLTPAGPGNLSAQVKEVLIFAKDATAMNAVARKYDVELV